MHNKNTSFPQSYTLRCRGKLISLDTPKVMGILNVTPNSFYDGGKLKTDKEILAHAEKMLNEGADFIDIGGMSTKPGAEEITEEEELKRVLPVISLLRKIFPESILSIDTYRSNIAKQAVIAGADIINDISGGTFDNKMLQTASTLRAPYIMMHIQGTPQTMQQNPVYKNVTEEVLRFFTHQIALAKEAGVQDIIIDVGFGFGKTLAHNYELLKNLHRFQELQVPVLTGVSRKSMINKVLHITPQEALNGTTVLHTIALLNGIHILRTHDVKEAKEAIQLVNYYQSV